MRHKAVLFSWLIACLSWAQEVVVLEFQADVGRRLSHQVENAILEHTAAAPMSLQAYLSGAARLGIADAQTAAGFSQTAVRFPEVVVAVWGKVEGGHVDIFIWDRAGAQLWHRRLPLSQGLLTQELSQRLARAIFAAVEIQMEAEASKKRAPGPSSSAPSAILAEHKGEAAKEMPTMDLRPQLSEPQTPFLRIAFQGTSSWRSLCIRPGRNSCIAFDKLPKDGRGNKDFSSGAYGGVFLQAEYFPLASLTPSFWEGLGLRTEVGYGRARKKFSAEAAAILTIQEVHWSAEALYRHFFLKPSSSGMGLQALVSLGYWEKNFQSDDLQEIGLLFPNTRRRSMSIGADAELSWPFIRFSLYGNAFIQPKPGRVVREAYGDVRSIGYRIGGAVSGKIHGPLGYRLDMSWNFFKDTFVAETRPEGGMIRETYLALKAGLLLEF